MPLMGKNFDVSMPTRAHESASDAIDSIIEDGIQWREQRYGYVIVHDRTEHRWLINRFGLDYREFDNFPEAWRYITSQPELPQEDTP